MRSTPFTSASIGVATVSATVLALGPGYVAGTGTVGGATSGYCAIGSCVSATPPTIRMTIDSTLAKIGRLMKKWEIIATPLKRALVPYFADAVAAVVGCDVAAAPARIGSTG